MKQQTLITALAARTPSLSPVPWPPLPVMVIVPPVELTLARRAAVVPVPATLTPVLSLPVAVAAVTLPAVPRTLTLPPPMMRALAPSTLTP